MAMLYYTHLQPGGFSLSINTDPYIFLEAGVRDFQPVHPTLTWRLVDEAHNLITVCIDRVSGLFLSTRVVFYNGVVQLFPKKQLKIDVSRQLDGLPCFSRDPWGDDLLIYDYSNKNDFHDVPGRAAVELYKDGSKLKLFPEQVGEYSTVHPEGLICEFNAKSELIAISLRNLSIENSNSIKRYAEKHGGLILSC